MVDVSKKPEIFREATASGVMELKPETVRLIKKGKVEKGDVFSLAKVAGILAAKKTSELIPLCHPLSLTSVTIDFTPDTDSSEIVILASVHARDRTGVEMEALVAVSTAALTIYDMCKSYDRGMIIHDIRLLEKRGGKSGLYQDASFSTT